MRSCACSRIILGPYSLPFVYAEQYMLVRWDVALMKGLENIEYRCKEFPLATLHVMYTVVDARQTFRPLAWQENRSCSSEAWRCVVRQYLQPTRSSVYSCNVRRVYRGVYSTKELRIQNAHTGTPKQRLKRRCCMPPFVRQILGLMAVDSLVIDGRLLF